MVFCNTEEIDIKLTEKTSHNPYFNRWFSAITLFYFFLPAVICHNPYFNRWFSAIKKYCAILLNSNSVTILILIDGFLQWC